MFNLKNLKNDKEILKEMAKEELKKLAINTDKNFKEQTEGLVEILFKTTEVLDKNLKILNSIEDNVTDEIYLCTLSSLLIDLEKQVLNITNIFMLSEFERENNIKEFGLSKEKLLEATSTGLAKKILELLSMKIGEDN